MNWLGLAAALSALLGIWAGHVAVRKIEFIAPVIWLPALLFAVVGLTFECFSLSTFNFQLSTALGILGITILWDALELARQQQRVQKGHAPANPHNPRHARILAAYPSATTVNLVKAKPFNHEGHDPLTGASKHEGLSL